MQALEELVGRIKNQSGVDLRQPVQGLVRLAHEQGYLTVDDIQEALPENVATADDLGEIYQRLGKLDIEIIDQSEADRRKQLKPDEIEEEARIDSLDDPLRMYFSQMGKVPLLTREQEVEVCRRIETDDRQDAPKGSFTVDAPQSHVMQAGEELDEVVSPGKRAAHEDIRPSEPSRYFSTEFALCQDTYGGDDLFFHGRASGWPCRTDSVAPSIASSISTFPAASLAICIACGLFASASMISSIV